MASFCLLHIAKRNVWKWRASCDAMKHVVFLEVSWKMKQVVRNSTKETTFYSIQSQTRAGLLGTRKYYGIFNEDLFHIFGAWYTSQLNCGKGCVYWNLCSLVHSKWVYPEDKKIEGDYPDIR